MAVFGRLRSPYSGFNRTTGCGPGTGVILKKGQRSSQVFFYAQPSRSLSGI